MPPKVRGRNNNNKRSGSGSSPNSTPVIATAKKSASDTIATLKHHAALADAAEKRIRADVGDKLANEFANTMKKLVDNGDFYTTRSVRSLEDILVSHYKSQMETGTSSGAESRSLRMRGSQQMFGTERGIQDDEYEKYGFLGSKDIDSAWADRPHYGGRDSGTQVMIGWKKDSLLGRTTFVIGDSLDHYDFHVIPGLITKDSVGITGAGKTMGGWFTSSKSAREQMMDVMKSARSTGYNPSRVGKEVARTYIETQMHGMYTASDMQTITMSKTAYSRLSQTAKDIIKQHKIRVVIK